MAPCLPGRAFGSSVWVERLGDRLFSLCRAAGIPARTTGGWRLFGGNFGGHFWAEFFLPNYGWIPVDPTMADIADYIPGLSEEERHACKDFCFANQDNYRCVVQHDVDVPLSPPATNPVFLSITLQQPAANCDAMKDMPDEVILEYWSLQAESKQP